MLHRLNVKHLDSGVNDFLHQTELCSVQFSPPYARVRVANPTTNSRRPASN